MGATCCIPARDRTIEHGPSGEILHRNIRQSPTWSFRWDNRVGVAGEDSSVGVLSDVARRNDALDVKSATDVSATVSDVGSSLPSFRMSASRKSPPRTETAKSFSTSPSGQVIDWNTSSEVKQSAEYPQDSGPGFVKQSPPIQTSLLCLSPVPDQSNPFPSPPVLSRGAHSSPGPHLAQQTCDIHCSGRSSPMDDGRAPHGPSVASNESTRGSYGRSFDGSSTHAFSEVMYASQRGRLSFDSDSFSLSHDKSSRMSGKISRAMSMDLQTCGICSKLLTEKSAWSSQIIIAGNELSVVAVLICGHVYHAECLETITSDINKYDPACPVCTFGEKQTLKLAGKLLKADKDLKTRISKKLRIRDPSFDFDHLKTGPREGKGPKMGNSSSLKISAAKPFLNRHFSFGSRSTKSALENPSIWKKGLFWKKSSRESASTQNF